MSKKKENVNDMKKPRVETGKILVSGMEEQSLLGISCRGCLGIYTGDSEMSTKLHKIAKMVKGQLDWISEISRKDFTREDYESRSTLRLSDVLMFKCKVADIAKYERAVYQLPFQEKNAKRLKASLKDCRKLIKDYKSGVNNTQTAKKSKSREKGILERISANDIKIAISKGLKDDLKFTKKFLKNLLKVSKSNAKERTKYENKVCFSAIDFWLKKAKTSYDQAEFIRNNIVKSVNPNPNKKGTRKGKEAFYKISFMGESCMCKSVYYPRGKDSLGPLGILAKLQYKLLLKTYFPDALIYSEPLLASVLNAPVASSIMKVKIKTFPGYKQYNRSTKLKILSDFKQVVTLLSDSLESDIGLGFTVYVDNNWNIDTDATNYIQVNGRLAAKDGLINAKLFFEALKNESFNQLTVSVTENEAKSLIKKIKKELKNK